MYLLQSVSLANLIMSGWKAESQWRQGVWSRVSNYSLSLDHPSFSPTVSNDIMFSGLKYATHKLLHTQGKVLEFAIVLSINYSGSKAVLIPAFSCISHHVSFRRRVWAAYNWVQSQQSKGHRGPVAPISLFSGQAPGKHVSFYLWNQQVLNNIRA